MNCSMTDERPKKREWNVRSRRQLSRSITSSLTATVSTVINSPLKIPDPGVNRIAFTGSPGAGKSTLIATFSKVRHDNGRHVAIIAIDPTSPRTGGAILGDRIRMDNADPSSDIYYRSVSSDETRSGLCRNADSVLENVESFGFNDVIVETVGVGQGEYAVRDLVHTVVVVLTPGSGDIIQAMKAGILEIADIYVVNKSDVSGAENLIQEIKSVLRITRQEKEATWMPPIIKVSNVEPVSGHDALSDAIDAHQSWRRENTSDAEIVGRRKRIRMASVIDEKTKNWLASDENISHDLKLLEDYKKLWHALDIDD